MILALFAFIIYNQSNTQRLAYIDIAVLMNEYQGMIDARAEYQKKAQTWQMNADTLAKEFETLVSSFEINKNKLSPKEAESQLNLIKAKRDQLRKYQETIQSKSAEEDRKMTDEVRLQINTYLKKYGNSSQYDIILGATELGNILYSKKGKDITQEVIEGLNNSYVSR